MSAAASYVFDSCLRTFYRGCSPFYAKNEPFADLSDKNATSSAGAGFLGSDSNMTAQHPKGRPKAGAFWTLTPITFFGRFWFVARGNP
jgi:hypothetical protein